MDIDDETNSIGAGEESTAMDMGHLALVEPIGDGTTKSRRKNTESKTKAAIERATRQELQDHATSVGAHAAVEAQKMLAGTSDEMLAASMRAPITKALTGFADMMDVQEKLETDKVKVQCRLAIETEIEAAHLGYAMVCFATDNDLGRGPTIRRGVLNPRLVRPSGVSHLKKSFMCGRLRNRSVNPLDHITLLVRRRALDTSKLARAYGEEVDIPFIKWVDDITTVIQQAKGQDLALVADGNHRATACEQLLPQPLDTYVKARSKLATMSAAEANGQMGSLYTEVAKEGLNLLLTNCSWLCKVYDWDLIEASKQRDAICLMLSENDIFFSQPDNNNDALQHLLQNITGRSAAEVDILLNVHRQARTTITQIESIFKDKDSLMVYAQPYQFEALTVTKLYRPTFMYQWLSCATDLAGPFLTLMVQTLLWLASPQKIDLQDPKTIKQVEKIVMHSAVVQESILDTSLFDHEFFQILEDSYLLYLHPAVATFALGEPSEDIDMADKIVSDEDEDEDEEVNNRKGKERAKDDKKGEQFLWHKAYPDYIGYVCKTVANWVAAKQVITQDMATKLTLDMVIPKIKFLYKQSMLGSHPNLPTINGNIIPLLSLLFYTDFAKSLSDVSDGLTVMYNWYEPFLFTMLKHQHVGKQTTDFDSKKPPRMFKEWLHYHMVRNLPITTVSLSADERKQLGLYNKTLRKITGTIISSRQSCLPLLNKYLQNGKDIYKQFMGNITTYYKNKEHLRELLAKRSPPVSLEDLPTLTVSSVLLGQLMLIWRASAQDFEKTMDDPDYHAHHKTRVSGVSRPGPLFRPGDNIRPDIDDHLKGESREMLTRLESVLDLLAHSAFNWADFHNNNALVLKPVRFAFFSWSYRRMYDRELEGSNDEMPTLHQGLASTGLEALDKDLKTSLCGLAKHVLRYGSVGEGLPMGVVEPYRRLILALTEVNLWKKATLDGKYKAKSGSIKLGVLEELATTILGDLPSLADGLSTQELAEHLPVVTNENISARANARNNDVLGLKSRWEQQMNAVSTRKKLQQKKREVQYALQLDTLKPVNPKQPAKTKEKKRSEAEPATAGLSVMPAIPGPSVMSVTPELISIEVDEPPMNPTLLSAAKANAIEQYDKRVGGILAKPSGRRSIKMLPSDESDSTNISARKRTHTQSNATMPGEKIRKRPRIAANITDSQLAAALDESGEVLVPNSDDVTYDQMEQDAQASGSNESEEAPEPNQPESINTSDSSDDNPMLYV